MIHASLLAWTGLFTSPTLDEFAHLPAGIAVAEYGRFDLYRVNPPIIKTIAAVPAIVGGAENDWSSYYESDFERSEWTVGRSFIAANDSDWFCWFKYARWMLIPISLLGGWVCYSWSSELYGASAGLLSLTLWCFSPNVLAWGATITPDLGAASFGLIATWRFWNWLRNPTWGMAFFAVVTLGLAELAKMTWIVLFVLWPVLWLVWRLIHRNDIPRDPSSDALLRSQSTWTQFGQLCLILLLGLYVLNVGYAFDGSFQRLGDYKFGTRLLAGDDSKVDGGPGGNRFTGTILERLPVPVPREYLRGMDLQWMDFEEKKLSYLNGEWKRGGWWYYYFEAILLKVPLGFWLIAIVALFLTFKDSRYRSRLRDELVLLAPALAVFVLVSSQTGFSRYLRYILPCFPFAFIWMSKVAQSVEWKQKKVTAITAFGLLWAIASSLWVFPHSMSYFNEVAGGPNGGHHYLLDANIDWGQDMFYLKEWYDEHPEARPIVIDCHNFVDLKHFDLESRTDPQAEIQWYAISAHRLFGKDSRYKHLHEREPIAKAGYSIWIFRVEQEKSEKL